MLALCRTYGLSRSEFLAWPEADQDAALAYEAHLAERCPSCGTAQADWRGPDNMPLLEPRWEVVTRRCDGCVEAARASDSIAQGERGVTVGFVPFGQGDAVE